ncbi:hypothetical protein LEP1GSC036_3488 [Leptospira weilii str. 2006001853]|uniref:Uncharacterized protein n=1 Tax=Leptospira weilii str. 2006001853 TaxID=1001589 RepID=A0A828ZAW1_9LEPT|nr:hypothetical protein LEP1GSC036_3488 [Leptospira weilii str. 2006001853]
MKIDFGFKNSIDPYFQSIFFWNVYSGCHLFKRLFLFVRSRFFRKKKSWQSYR